MSYVKKMSAVLFSTLMAITLRAQLSGTYTVGGSSPNYVSVDSAIIDLVAKGVSAKVTFLIRPGTYTAKHELKAFTGASVSNMVTFRPDPASSGVVNLYNAPTATTDNWTLRINASGYVTFKKLQFSTGGTTYGRVIDFIGNVTDVTFDSCRFIGTTPSGTSNNMAVLNNPSGTGNMLTNTTFSNCSVERGSFGFYCYSGSSTVFESNNSFINNRVTNYYTQGLYLYGQDSLIVDNCYFEDTGTYSSVYGIQAQYGGKNLRISNNTIINKSSGTSYGISMSYQVATSTSDEGRVYNNFVSLITTTNTSSTAYGIYTFNGYYQTIANNSVYLAGGSATAGRALYINSNSSGSYGNVNLLNNCIVNTGAGYGVEISANAVTLGYVSKMDYNNYYATGTAPFRYNSSNYTTLSGWVSACLKDSNSINVNPNYFSATNLHTASASLNAAALPISWLTKDIDGQTRNVSTPDIGGDEFNPPSLDAGLNSLQDLYCLGNQDVMVRIKNSGADTIFSVKVAWQVSTNGGAYSSQTTYNHNDTILSGKDTLVKLGVMNFIKGNTYIIKAWSTAPNGSADVVNSNDTLTTKSFGPALEGTYTVGGTSPDYSTLADAFAAMKSNGVCGKVRLNVREGTYTERFVIEAIPGASTTNTILVAPDPGNTTPVTFTNTMTSASDNYILSFKQGYIAFDSIQFKIEPASKYGGRVADFPAASTDIQFRNCTFIGKDTSSTSTNYSILYESSTYLVNNFVLKNNTFYNGSYVVYHYGSSATDETGTLFTGNKFYKYSYVPTYLYYQKSAVVTYNYGADNNTNAAAYGAYFNNCDSVTITNNRYNVNGGSGYGLYMSACFGSATSPNIIANNFISGYDGSRSGAYDGLYITGGSYSQVYFNTVFTNNLSTGSHAVYLLQSTAGQNTEFKNNNVIHRGAGYAMYYGTSIAGIGASDYNNYFTNGASLGYLSSAYATLTAMQNGTGMDKNSINENVTFVNDTNLHTNSLELDAMATPISGITIDIDGDTRNGTTPDIGADEYVLPAKDLAVRQILTSELQLCGKDSNEIGVVIRNHGSADQTGFTTTLQITGAGSKTISLTYNDTLVSKEIDTIYFGKFSTTSGGTFNFTAYISLSGDINKLNDTLRASAAINSTPGMATPKKDTLCTNASGELTTAHPALSTLRWYDAPAGGNLIATADTLLMPKITEDTTLYVSAAFSGTKPGYINTITTSGNSCQGGIIFDVQPKQDLIVDSFSTIFYNTTTQWIYVWVKMGTYSGYETTPSAWTLWDSIQVTPNTSTGLTVVALNNKATMQKDSIYGVYFNYYARYTSLAATYSNNDVQITTGSGMCSRFGGLNTGRTWNGELFYRVSTLCESDRVPYEITASPEPQVNLGNDTFFCTNEGLNLTLDAGSGFSNYLWQDGTGAQTNLATSKGDYFVTVTDARGCKGSDSINIKEYANPMVSLGNDLTFCADPGVNTTLDAGLGFAQYLWNTGDQTRTINATQDGLYSIIVTDFRGCPGKDTLEIFTFKNPVVDLGSDGIYCSSDGIDLWLDGGAGYVNYDWSTGETSQQKHVTGEENLRLIVTDTNGCTGMDSFISIELESPVVDLGNDTAYCSYNGINLTLDAGSGFASYLWNTGNVGSTLAVNTAGNYKVSVTSNNGCVTDDSLVVTENLPPVIFIGKDTGYCAGTPFSTTLNAGTGYPVYLWSNGQSSSSIQVNDKGSYDVVVQDDNGCVGKDSIEIFEYANPVANLGADQNYCDNTIWTALLDAGAGYAKYEWSNAAVTQQISVNAVGKYSVKITDDKGCVDQDTVEVIENPSPSVNLGSDKSLNPDLPVNVGLDGGSGVTSYLWSTGATTRNITATANGTYWVKVTNLYGCTDSDTIVIASWDIANGLNNFNENGLALYPNPANTGLNIISANAALQLVKVQDLSGKVVLETNVSGNTARINTETLNNGVYIFTVKTVSGSASYRVIIQH